MIDSCIIGLEAVVFGTLERFLDPVECVFGCAHVRQHRIQIRLIIREFVLFDVAQPEQVDGCICRHLCGHHEKQSVGQPFSRLIPEHQQH